MIRPVIENSIKIAYEGKVKGVVFGWIGTLVDPFSISPIISTVTAFRQHGINVNVNEVRNYTGVRSDIHIKNIINDFTVKKRWIEEFQREPTETDITKINNNFETMQLKILPSYAKLIPGVLDTTHLLREKYKIKIGTTTWLDRNMVDIMLNKNPEFVPDYNVAGDDLVKSLCGESTPFILWKCLFNMGIHPIQSVIRVDDTVNGIREGLSTGCWTVAVSDWGNYMNINSMGEYSKMNLYQLEERKKIAKKRLMESGAHYVIDDLKNLPDVIDDINYKLSIEVQPFNY